MPDILRQMWDYLSSDAAWSGSRGLPSLMWAQVKLSATAVIIAAVIAIPPAVVLGHVRRGALLAVSVVNIGRALPTFAIMVLILPFSLRWGFGLGFWPTVVALVLLGIPPIFTNTYTGVRQVDRDTVDSARGMGMTGAQIVRRVELPLSLPLTFGGIRISAVNVIATATIAPLAGVTTLGDPIINVNTYGDEGRLAAALVVALLAVATELVLGAVQRAVTPQGLKLEGGGTRWRRFAMALPNNRREATP
jgi:osmoprotectant transport system permease protein